MAKPLSCILVTIQDEHGVSQKVFTENTLTVGRSPDCAISCQEPNVSRHHLSIKNKGGKLWIEDLGSANGTYLNGEKIEAKRLMPIEPGDKVRLGKDGKIILSLWTIERAFSEDAVKEGRLEKDDRDSVLDLIQGAHAEAARLVNFGKESYDNHIRVGEERSKQIEQQMATNYEQIIAEAKKQAQAIMDKARHEHDSVVTAATSVAAVEAKSTADRLASEARDAAERIATEVRMEAEKVLLDAKSVAERTISEAHNSSDTILVEAKRGANDLLEEAREQAENESQEHFEKKRREFDVEVAKMIADVENFRRQQDEDARTALETERTELAENKEHVIQELTALEKKVKADLAELERNTDAELAAREQKLEADLKEGTEELKRLTLALEDSRAQAKKLEKTIQSGKKEFEDLQEGLKAIEASVADLKELETRRKTIVKQLADAKEKLEVCGKDLERKLSENLTKVEDDLAKRKKAADTELTNLRLSELDRLKRERVAVMAELSRDRERLGQKIMIDVQTAAVRSISPENWRQAEKDVEAVIQEHLKLQKVDHAGDESISPLIADMAKAQRRSRLVWTTQGLLAGMIVFFGLIQLMDKMSRTNDPVQSEAEEQRRQTQEDLQARKFNPAQNDEWRDTYSNLVIYKKDFVENYRSQEFQKHWMKVATKYFLKNWKVQEENVVGAAAHIDTLVGTLAERKDEVHPDHVKEDLQKMDDLEAETMNEVKELLGSEVRIEAFKRLEKKTYSEFFSTREPTSGNPEDEK
jgi:pSer/pThr/pTyr-binding forkhead associated (FHA) protein/vacuolar-type H+-ATPase subunit H